MGLGGALDWAVGGVKEAETCLRPLGVQLQDGRAISGHSSESCGTYNPGAPAPQGPQELTRMCSTWC